jgi:hypothetical protein
VLSNRDFPSLQDDKTRPRPEQDSARGYGLGAARYTQSQGPADDRYANRGYDRGGYQGDRGYGPNDRGGYQGDRGYDRGSYQGDRGYGPSDRGGYHGDRGYGPNDRGGYQGDRGGYGNQQYQRGYNNKPYDRPGYSRDERDMGPGPSDRYVWPADRRCIVKVYGPCMLRLQTGPE